MKVKVNRMALFMAIRRINKLNPRMMDLHMEAKNNQLVLKMATAKVASWLSIDAEVEEDGATVVRYTTFARYVDLAGADITLETFNKHLIFTSENYSIKMPVPVESFFFERPAEPILWQQTFKAKKFWHLINMVQVNADGENDNKPVLEQIEFAVNDGVLTLAATDGYTLSRYQETTGFLPICFYIHGKTIAKLGNLLAKNELMLSVTEREVRIEQTEMYFTSLTVFENRQTKYPDYESIIPKCHYASAKVSRLSLLKNLKRAAVVSPVSLVNLAFNVGFDGLLLSTLDDPSSKEFGSYAAKLTAEIDGNIEICFNYKLINRCLSALTNENVLLEFTQATRPMTMRVTVDDGEMLYVIMPMRPPQ